MRFIILFLLFSNYGCSQRHEKNGNPVNPEAKKLNDSAVNIAMHSYDYAKAVTLLDKATLIDSNYFAAYRNKLSFQGLIKPFDVDKILTILKSMNRLRPLDPEYYMNIGMIYFKKGDSTTSSLYFTNAISHFDNILDTIHTTNQGYEVLVMNKAYTLIFQGQDQKGHDLLQKLYESSKDTVMREMLFPVLGKTRQEIINSIAFD